jgi:hypothetical protein
VGIAYAIWLLAISHGYWLFPMVIGYGHWLYGFWLLIFTLCLLWLWLLSMAIDHWLFPMAMGYWLFVILGFDF